MKFLLDTHTLLWWVGGSSNLTKRYHDILSNTQNEKEIVAISSISLWELAKLEEKGRIDIQLSLDDWFEELEEHPLLAVLPITGRVALESSRLGSSFPKDPSDQIIAATARCHGLRLLTADKKIRDSGVVAVI